MHTLRTERAKFEFGTGHLFLQNKNIVILNDNDQEKIGVPTKNLTHGLPCRYWLCALTSELQKIRGELGHLLGSYVTHVLHTARITQCRKRHMCNSYFVSNFDQFIFAIDDLFYYRMSLLQEWIVM